MGELNDKKELTVASEEALLHFHKLWQWMLEHDPDRASKPGWRKMHELMMDLHLSLLPFGFVDVSGMSEAKQLTYKRAKVEEKSYDERTVVNASTGEQKKVMVDKDGFKAIPDNAYNDIKIIRFLLTIPEATEFDITKHLKMKVAIFRPIFTELVKGGWIIDTGETKRIQKGSKLVDYPVYALTERGRNEATKRWGI